MNAHPTPVPPLYGFAAAVLFAVALIGCTTERPGPVPPVKNIEQQRWSVNVAFGGAR